MENLIFSLNATVPIFLLMILGFLLKKLGVIDDVFASKMNKFVFLIPLPVLLFEDLSTVDFAQVWNMKFVLFCFVVTLVCIILAALVSFLWHDKSIQGEFIQASYRSSAALLGIAFIQNIYGNAGMAPLMIIGSVPLYNIMAVVVLSFFKPDRKKLDKEVWKTTLKGIVTNPIILGIAAGLLWSALRLPMPSILEKTVSDIGAVATPLGLMAMGASFDIKKAFGKVKPAAAASVMKLVLFAALFLPLAVWMGFRREELVAILVMLSSATTVSCYVMARNMGHEGVLTSSVVMLTTLFSAFTMTGWLYILRSMGMV
ncbi:AEC family transporter [Mediterraneibacter catenae]|uniref:AEC family transporter n=1 Tax=Mediterraneibacter catenae TaxID=2594882 RepID=A0A5M9I5C2_9FIRM|nr:AEC family transporter [Mediterraneibacter catenae]KAA8502975.1 AEC family transporter [Mediterraneibacter catenae]